MRAPTKDKSHHLSADCIFDPPQLAGMLLGLYERPRFIHFQDERQAFMAVGWMNVKHLLTFFNGSTDCIAVNAQYASRITNARPVEHHWHNLLLNAGVAGFTRVGFEKCAPEVIATITLSSGWRNAISFDLLS